MQHLKYISFHSTEYCMPIDELDDVINELYKHKCCFHQPLSYGESTRLIVKIDQWPSVYWMDLNKRFQFTHSINELDWAEIGLFLAAKSSGASSHYMQEHYEKSSMGCSTGLSSITRLLRIANYWKSAAPTVPFRCMSHDAWLNFIKGGSLEFLKIDLRKADDKSIYFGDIHGDLNVLLFILIVSGYAQFKENKPALIGYKLGSKSHDTCSVEDICELPFHDRIQYRLIPNLDVVPDGDVTLYGTGDYLDRSDLDHEVLATLMHLKRQEAELQTNRLILPLGDHETYAFFISRCDIHFSPSNVSNDPYNCEASINDSIHFIWLRYELLEGIVNERFCLNTISRRDGSGMPLLVQHTMLSINWLYKWFDLSLTNAPIDHLSSYLNSLSTDDWQEMSDSMNERLKIESLDFLNKLRTFSNETLRELAIIDLNSETNNDTPIDFQVWLDRTEGREVQRDDKVKELNLNVRQLECVRQPLHLYREKDGPLWSRSIDTSIRSISTLVGHTVKDPQYKPKLERFDKSSNGIVSIDSGMSCKIKKGNWAKDHIGFLSLPTCVYSMKNEWESIHYDPLSTQRMANHGI